MKKRFMRKWASIVVLSIILISIFILSVCLLITAEWESKNYAKFQEHQELRYEVPSGTFHEPVSR